MDKHTSRIWQSFVIQNIFLLESDAHLSLAARALTLFASFLTALYSSTNLCCTNLFAYFRYFLCACVPSFFVLGSLVAAVDAIVYASTTAAVHIVLYAANDKSRVNQYVCTFLLCCRSLSRRRIERMAVRGMRRLGISIPSENDMNAHRMFFLLVRRNKKKCIND